MRYNRKSNEGITLIALVITVIVLIILAGVAISMLSGDNGILRKAAEAKEKTEQVAKNEASDLADLETIIENEGDTSLIGFNESKGVNSPELDEGMIPEYKDGKWTICSETDEEWYNYTEEDKQWANVMLCDGKYDETTPVGTEVATDDLGSMFVWIPRYAYQITSNYHSNSTGEIEVTFLKGTHPAFTNNVEVGGWSKNLTGIWVAKFEA